jgi:hypothetical protein
MEGKGVYKYEESDYDITIEYQIYWDEGTYDVSPESELTIVSVKLNSFEGDSCECAEVDITSIFMDHMSESSVSKDLWDYAWENKDN